MLNVASEGLHDRLLGHGGLPSPRPLVLNAPKAAPRWPGLSIDGRRPRLAQGAQVFHGDLDAALLGVLINLPVVLGRDSTVGVPHRHRMWPTAEQRSQGGGAATGLDELFDGHVQTTR